MRCSTERVPTRSRGLDGRGKSWSPSHHRHQPPTTAPKGEEELEWSETRRSRSSPPVQRYTANEGRIVCAFSVLTGFCHPAKTLSRETVRVSFPLAERHLDETSAFSLRDTMPGVSRSATDRGKASDAFPSGNEDCSRRSIGPSPHRPRSLAAARVGSRRRTYRTLLRTVSRREAAGPQG